MVDFETTVPSSNSGSSRDEPPRLALVLLWSEEEPERIGEVAFPDPSTEMLLGRGTPGLHRFVVFDQQRPIPGAQRRRREWCLAGKTISREHVSLLTTATAMEIEAIGRNPVYVNGELAARAALVAGNGTMMLKEGALFGCVSRTRELPALEAYTEMHEFGELDSAGRAGESPVMWDLREQLASAGKWPGDVMLFGESGSGKESSARSIHACSPRAGKPFLGANVAEIPESLCQAELFGNLPNYPNPGMIERAGLLHSANGGTLFLDEAGEMPKAMQAALLRALAERECKRLGEARPRKFDLRVVCATNQKERVFRPEFAARFKKTIWVPPLRERREDIPLIIRHAFFDRELVLPEVAARFLRKGRDGKLYPRLDGKLVDYLVRHPLPNNVRQLHELLRIAIEQSKGDRVLLPASFGKSPPPLAPPPPAFLAAPRTPQTRTTKEKIEEALATTNSVAEAARSLGIPRTSFRNLMKEYGIDIPTKDDT